MATERERWLRKVVDDVTYYDQSLLAGCEVREEPLTETITVIRFRLGDRVEGIALACRESYFMHYAGMFPVGAQIELRGETAVIDYGGGSDVRVNLEDDLRTAGRYIRRF